MHYIDRLRAMEAELALQQAVDASKGSFMEPPRPPGQFRPDPVLGGGDGMFWLDSLWNDVRAIVQRQEFEAAKRAADYQNQARRDAVLRDIEERRGVAAAFEVPAGRDLYAGE